MIFSICELCAEENFGINVLLKKIGNLSRNPSDMGIIFSYHVILTILN